MSGAAPARSTTTTAAAAFRRGVWNRNPLLLLAAVALAFVLLAGLELAVSDGAASRLPVARFLRTDTDDAGFVSWQVAALQRHPPGGAVVYLVGGSNVRECIPSPQSLAAALQQTTGRRTAVYDLGGNNQDLAESLAVVDSLPATPGAVVVVSINQTRLAYTPDQLAQEAKGRELVLSSPTLRAFVHSHAGARLWPLPIVPGIMSYAASYVQQNGSSLLHLHLADHPYQRHRYTQTTLMSVRGKRRKVELWLTGKGRPGGQFDRCEAYNAALLEAIVRRARERGFTVALMEPPENAAIVRSSFDRFKAVYRPLCRSLAARYGGAYLHFGRRLDLVNTDFRDITHLVETGRLKWQAALARALSPLLQRGAS